MFEHRVALVTGGARGIGLEIGRWLARAGARVALADVKADAAKQVAQELRRAGSEVIDIPADVSDWAEVRLMTQHVIQEWGWIDILVNNAGICPMTPIENITVVEWDLVMGTNLRSAFLCSKAVIPTMRERRYGKIINIASSAGQMGGLAVGVHYSTSKAGMLGLTKSLARILAPDIQVNAISPGTTESEMTDSWDQGAIDGIMKQVPAGRLGRPADVAAAVLFLASEEAHFITGQTLNVNGGLLMV